MRSIGRALGAAVVVITVLFWAFTRLTVVAGGGDAPPSDVDTAVVTFLVMPASAAPADAPDGDAVDWQAVALEALARADDAEREQRACELARLEHAFAAHPDGVVIDDVLGFDDDAVLDELAWRTAEARDGD